MRASVPVLVLVLSGCERLEGIEESASPLVAQGLFLGVDIPAGVDVSGSEELSQAALCEVFLAQVEDPSQLAEAPMEGAEMTMVSPSSGALTFQEEGEGKYTVDSTSGLIYEPGDAVTVTFVTPDGEEGRMQVAAPQAPEIELPTLIQTFDAVQVDLSDYTYQNVVAAAYDVERETISWDNLPSGVEEIYAYTHTEEPVRVLEIPGDAFRRKGMYVVGVAGMEVAEAESFEGVNTTLSAFMAGQLALALVVVEGEE